MGKVSNYVGTARTSDIAIARAQSCEDKADAFSERNPQRSIKLRREAAQLRKAAAFRQLVDTYC